MPIPTGLLRDVSLTYRDVALSLKMECMALQEIDGIAELALSAADDAIRALGIASLHPSY
ncbi:MAG: hypothetical protein ACM3SP_25940 [Chloroflexota bacterium]